MTSWRSRDGKYKLLDGELYMAVTQNGKPMWVHLEAVGGLEVTLLKLLLEAVG